MELFASPLATLMMAPVMSFVLAASVMLLLHTLNLKGQQ